MFTDASVWWLYGPVNWLLDTWFERSQRWPEPVADAVGLLLCPFYLLTMLFFAMTGFLVVGPLCMIAAAIYIPGRLLVWVVVTAYRAVR